MPSQSQKTVFEFTVDRPWTGYLQLLFEEDVCTRSRVHYPVSFQAEQVTRFNLNDPGFTDEFSTVVKGLVEVLVYGGFTGVEVVAVSSRRGLKIIYDPKVYKPRLLRKHIRSTVRYIDRFGWSDSRDRLLNRMDVIEG